MAKLTKGELRLLKYPPTPETWVCGCNMANPGSRTTCSLCGKKKGKRVKRLWNPYVKACKKAGVEPRKGVVNDPS